ncbi:hypothetical protein ACFLZJ_01540 [Nanoarchaeota archaeon]
MKIYSKSITVIALFVLVAVLLSSPVSAGLSCDEAVLSGALTGSINGNTATITNNHDTQAWKVGFTSYRMYDNNIDNQVIYGYDYGGVYPGETVEFEINLPSCRYQADIFCGDILWSLYNGQRYDDRLIQGKLGNTDKPYCTPVCGNGGLVEPGEQCDEGKDNGDVCVPPTSGSCTYCTDTCQWQKIYDKPDPTPDPYCGDGNKDSGEQCDDGNNDNGDGCSSICELEDITEDPLTIVVNKVVCEDEESLPNLHNGPDITSTTAQDFVDANSDCEFKRNWEFQWGFGGQVSNPGDHVGEAGGNWHTFGPTNSGGKTSVTISNLDDLGENNRIWVREVFKSGYLGFTGSEENDVSAEMFCHKDALVYDNYDYVVNPELGNTYYCIAINVGEREDEPVCGNNIVEGDEECDGTSGVHAGYVCNDQCQEVYLPSCGDGIIQIGAGEECDDGEMNGEEGYCKLDCTEPSDDPDDPSGFNFGFNNLNFGVCEPLWTCGGWSECNDGVVSRNCVDMNSCDYTYNQPAETVGCDKLMSIPDDTSGNANPIFWLLIGIGIILILIIIALLVA